MSRGRFHSLMPSRGRTLCSAPRREYARYSCSLASAATAARLFLTLVLPGGILGTLLALVPWLRLALRLALAVSSAPGTVLGLASRASAGSADSRLGHGQA